MSANVEQRLERVKVGESVVSKIKVCERMGFNVSCSADCKHQFKRRDVQHFVYEKRNPT